MTKCNCTKQPACEQHGHVGAFCIEHGHIVLTIPNADANPPCVICTGPTQRTGMCFTCRACGATTSC